MIQQTEIDGNKRDGKLQTATAVREKIQQDAVLTKEKTGTKMLIQKAEPLGNGKGKIGEGSKMQNGSNFPEQTALQGAQWTVKIVSGKKIYVETGIGNPGILAASTLKEKQQTRIIPTPFDPDVETLGASVKDKGKGR